MGGQPTSAAGRTISYVTSRAVVMETWRGVWMGSMQRGGGEHQLFNGVEISSRRNRK
jgi:hypothetical protein